jgi:hypothetical protein
MLILKFFVVVGAVLTAGLIALNAHLTAPAAVDIGDRNLCGFCNAPDFFEYGQSAGLILCLDVAGSQQRGRIDASVYMGGSSASDGRRGCYFGVRRFPAVAWGRIW